MLVTDAVLTVLLVVGARLLVPLAIPKFPLPASIASIVIDFVDGTTAYDAFAKVGLTDYQGYDKALDVYYLSIQYLSTMRNWGNLFAFNVGRVLFYYRLAGGVLFELLQIRALFLIFPNAFEYFFLFYEAVRLRWNPRRLGHGVIIGVVVAIWVLIKIPQEYWIHIAQLDVTDVKQSIFQVPGDTGWGAIVTQNVAFFVALAAIMVAVIAFIRWSIMSKLPAADWRLSFDADAHGRDISTTEARAIRRAGARHFLDAELVEKTVLVSAVTIIFSGLLPTVHANVVSIAFGVAIVIVANTAISEWLITQGIRWQSAFVQFMVMAAINSVIAAGFLLVLSLQRVKLDLASMLFSLLLLTLLVTLYDRYRPIFLARTFLAHEVSPD